MDLPESDHVTYFIWCWPPVFQLLGVETPLQHPAEARHGLHPVDGAGVVRGVLVALVVPGGHAVEAGVGLQDGHQLGEIGEEVGGDVEVLLQQDCILGVGEQLEGGGKT